MFSPTAPHIARDCNVILISLNISLTRQHCPHCDDLLATNATLSEKLRASESRADELAQRLHATLENATSNLDDMLDKGVKRQASPTEHLVAAAGGRVKSRRTSASNTCDQCRHCPCHQTDDRASLFTSEDEGLGLHDLRSSDRSSGPSSLAHELGSTDDDCSTGRTSTAGSTCGSDHHHVADACVQTQTCRPPTRDAHCQADTAAHDLAALRAELEHIRQDNAQLQLQLDEMKLKHDQERDTLAADVAKLRVERDSLSEQVLELEEAENDARLMSQRLQTQLRNVCEQLDNVQGALVDARATNEQHAARQRLLEVSERTLTKQLDELKALISSNTPGGQLRAADALDARLAAKIAEVEQQLSSYREELAGDASDESDLQLFISPDDMAPSGSSFEPSSLQYQLHNVQNVQPQQQQQQNVQSGQPQSLDDSGVELPLCEAIKAKKIDVMVQAAKENQPGAIQSLLEALTGLENNEKQLRERLHQLEMINRDFVTELELREQLLAERQAALRNDNELDALEQDIKQLETELEQVSVRKVQIVAERDRLQEEVKARRPVRPPRRNVSKVVLKMQPDDCSSLSSSSSCSSMSHSLVSNRIEMFTVSSSCIAPVAVDEVLTKLESQLQQVSEEYDALLERELSLFDALSKRCDQLAKVSVDQ